ncbi:LacI family transcriptional regulator [Roseibacterium sp. SDUM158016]|jgi:DNA-binding LacI/PurR family transcriptional regulator|uniref:LacI family DNA-binding transcriptional regulator n=1 Tax=Roseicyclus sediminis TaxID=2980997 RepID=UPI0021D17195|nr:LacI family DNA-binding transcriptional regulator [Roseibacterium sp. SDUM158016]MCU4652743.1 LacI family transcriptional regulator [Roseibacterium sp. SDUM158016]
MSEQKIRNMEEFAAVSGLSRPTVSKYFNDPDSVRSTTRARIEAALERYDFRPNIYAVNQNRRLTKNIGIVVPYLADPVFAEHARSIEKLCNDAGFRSILLSSHGGSDQERENLDSLRALKPAGVLLAPLGRASDRSEIERFCRDVPTVLFDSNIEGMGEAFIGSDNASFVNQTVDYLCRSGETPCFFEMRTPANPNANKRRIAYIQAMERHGQEPVVVSVEGDGWGFEEIGRQGAHSAIAAGDFKTDTILCSNDRLAIGVLAACYERGLRVGRGPGCAFRVASHDDHPFSRFTCPALTTAAHNYSAVAERSVKTLFEVIENGGHLRNRTETLLPAQLVVRASA